MKIASFIVVVSCLINSSFAGQLDTYSLPVNQGNQLVDWIGIQDNNSVGQVFKLLNTGQMDAMQLAIGNALWDREITLSVFRNDVLLGESSILTEDHFHLKIYQFDFEPYIDVVQDEELKFIVEGENAWVGTTFDKYYTSPFLVRNGIEQPLRTHEDIGFRAYVIHNPEPSSIIMAAVLAMGFVSIKRM